MIDVYSNDVIVPVDGIYPLNVTKITKGCTATINGSNVELNRAGVYMVSVDAYLAPTADGTVGIQLEKDGVLQPQAISTSTGTADDPVSLSFETLIQCTQNNSNCCCSSPSSILIKNVGEQEASGHIHMVVTKVC